MQTIQFLNIDGTQATSSFSVVPVNFPTVNGQAIITGDPLNYSGSPQSVSLVGNLYKLEYNDGKTSNTWYFTGSNAYAANNTVSASVYSGSIATVLFDFNDSDQTQAYPSRVTIKPVNKSVAWSSSFIVGDPLTFYSESFNTNTFTMSLVPQVYEVTASGIRKTPFKFVASGSCTASLSIVSTQNVAANITPQNAALYTYTAAVIDGKLNAFATGSLVSNMLYTITASAALTASTAFNAQTASFVTASNVVGTVANAANAQTASFVSASNVAGTVASASVAATASVLVNLNANINTGGTASFTRLGVGTSTPAYLVHTEDSVTVSKGGNYSSNYYHCATTAAENTYYISPFQCYAEKYGANNNNSQMGIRGAQFQAINNGAGTCNEAAGVLVQVTNLGSGQINSTYGLYVYQSSVSPSTPIGTSNGVYIGSQSGSGVTKGYSIYSPGANDEAHFAGYMTIGNPPTNTNALTVQGSISASVITASLNGTANTASYVAGANVVGTVANAQTASCIAAGNVNGTVASAATASVAQTASYVVGANVVGTVSNATNAVNSQTASCVSATNVVGTVANATNAQTASLSNGPWVPSGNNVYFTNGFVGIGTSSPGFPLDIEAAVNNGYGVKIRNNNSGVSAYANFYMLADQSGAGGAGSGFFMNSSTRTAEVGANGFGFYNDYGAIRFRALNNVIFSTEAYPGTDRMTIHSGSGNVGIGTSNPLNKLDVAGNISCSVVTASQVIAPSNGTLTLNRSAFVNAAGNLTCTDLNVGGVASIDGASGEIFTYGTLAVAGGNATIDGSGIGYFGGIQVGAGGAYFTVNGAFVTTISNTLDDGAGGMVVANDATFHANITANGYNASDGSPGITATQTFKDGTGTTRTMTIKNGLITSIV